MDERVNLPKIALLVNLYDDEMTASPVEPQAIKRAPKPWIKLSWSVICLMVFGIAILQTLPTNFENDDEQEDPAGLVIMQLQCQYMLGVAELSGDYKSVAAQANMLDMGTVDQRQRYMAFMIAMGEPEAAKQSALQLQTVLEDSTQKLTEDQASIQESLDILANEGTLPESATLVHQMGWFSSFLFADTSERNEIASAASMKVFIVGIGALMIGIFGIFGFVMLVIFFVKFLNSSLHTKLSTQSQSHGIYAEVFALWIIVFMLLQLIFVGLLGSLDAVKDRPVISLALTLIAFFGSLCVLCWPVIRGIPWHQVKEDIGWHKGEGVLKELSWGVMGYGMTLPIIVGGVLLTLLLMFFQGLFIASGGNELHGTGGGSHPIIVDIANGSWDLRLMLLLLASVAAPIVEETVFRGVLYRQVRSSSWKFGNVLSVLLSVLLVSFVFAAIHPQGWVAIPALMGIAIGMNLLREYRGSIIAPMTIHGVSNGLVTSLMIFFIS